MRIELETKHKTVLFEGKFTDDLREIVPIENEPEICELLDLEDILYASIGHSMSRRYKVKHKTNKKFTLKRI